MYSCVFVEYLLVAKRGKGMLTRTNQEVNHGERWTLIRTAQNQPTDYDYDYGYENYDDASIVTRLAEMEFIMKCKVQLFFKCILIPILFPRGINKENLLN